MKVVVDAIGVRPGSAAIVTANLLRGWTQHEPDDELVLLVDGEPRFAVPSAVTVRSLTSRTGILSRLWAQSVGVRRSCQILRSDALLSAVTAGALLGARCPRGAIVYDMRHELRPDQFSRGRRGARKVLYGWTFRHADALFCISARTRADLIRRRPRLAARTHATPLGADHASNWHPVGQSAGRYVLAFGHFPNKNLAAVLEGWALFDGDESARLRVCGLGREGRKAAEGLVARLGIADTVELMGWLTDKEFEAVFAGAAMVLFPSDFEGFGLPVAEALLLGIPVVISADPALAEVSAGHATIAADDRPESLARAMVQALGRSPEQLRAGAEHARTLTWAGMAAQIRSTLAAAGSRT